MRTVLYVTYSLGFTFLEKELIFFLNILTNWDYIVQIQKNELFLLRYYKQQTRKVI
jgi:hypothetical protein